MQSKIKVHYTKPPLFECSNQEVENPKTYNPFDLENLQLYNPIYSMFFDMNEKNYNKIGLNHRYHAIKPDEVFDLQNNENSKKSIFFKYSPILDPFRYMNGKYDILDPKYKTLPKWNHSSTEVSEKLLSIYNASYIDSFFNFLSSQLLAHHGFLHGVDYYGSYLAKQKQFRVCVTDDLDYLRSSDFFNDHVGKLFYIDSLDMSYLDAIRGSHKNKPPIEIVESEESVLLKDVFDLNLGTFQDILDQEETEMDLVYTKDGSDSKRSSSSSSDSGSSDSSDNTDISETTEENESGSESGSDSGSGSGSDSDSDSDSSEGEEQEIYGYIYDFPVQMICMEKCDGTLDELFVQKKMNEQSSASCIFQIIMILIFYKKAFHFTHNDLHTNNVMYVNTDEPYLYYQFKGKTYQVPTYGKIYKIIDFGRGIYKFQGKLFCSDSFANDGDASTQYNCEPFMNKNKPRLEPNYSFDLCRLACSIFDFVMEYDTPHDEMDLFQKLVYEWCLDDNGRNVLYKSNGEERYARFKLYKMIARTVHHCIPEDQLENPLFQSFLCIEIDFPSNIHIMNIDVLPTYYGGGSN